MRGYILDSIDQLGVSNLNTFTGGGGEGRCPEDTDETRWLSYKI